MQDAHQIVLTAAQIAGTIRCTYFDQIVSLKAKDEHRVGYGFSLRSKTW